MEVLFELDRPIGNALARKICNNKAVEENSILSDALGVFVIVCVVIALLLVLLKNA